MAPAKILELLRGDVGELGNRDPNQRPKKEFFITLQYIKHCKSRIKAQGRLHKEDHISVDMHVRNLMHIGRFEVDGVKNDRYDGFDDGNFSPILVYKPQGKPVVVGHPNFDCIKNSAELFIVGFQTKEQLDVMKEGCKTVLCIDSTYSTNEYGFYLVNMVVQDPYGQGYPVAHFITNFQDEETLALAFESIKFRCPNLEVNLLMTDDDQAEYKAFLLIFPGTRHVLCTWHVRRNWNKNMPSIGDKELRRLINHSLAVLMYEKHEPTFQTLLIGFIAQFKSRCPVFIEYFEKYYKERPSVWALCYRNFPHGNTDTNMYCESLHNLLKTYYMERIQNKRVDDLTQIVLRMERDYFMKLWKNKAEGKAEVSVTVTQKRKHTRGIAIKDEDVTHIKGHVWAVRSQDEKKKDSDEEYFVVKHNEKCPVDHCFVQCVTQACKGLCEHLYTCTCPCPGGMCKHIHKVHSIFLRETSTTNHTDREGEFWDAEEGGNLHLTNPVEVEVHSKEEKDRKNVEEVQSLCEILKDRCSKPENFKFLDHIKTQLQQMEAMTRNTNKQAPVVEMGTKFQPTMSVNGPQKLVTQSDLKFKRIVTPLIQCYQIFQQNRLNCLQ
ncbi:uncharacterized protein LOC117639071 [Thrips palmi]|uniref:Uncharacterized protein LOC117639071 n=1 Tax=Thrips palmi TaxID=161013 RepID=A0A6P8Y256_THRPL|nr:uncharacterized protein LOC117639071 [Thrips palmi]